MKVLRNSLWFYKGLKEYTKSGFENASKKFNPADLEVNCNGQSFMITGANSGLGKQVMYIHDISSRMKILTGGKILFL